MNLLLPNTPCPGSGSRLPEPRTSLCASRPPFIHTHRHPTDSDIQTDGVQGLWDVVRVRECDAREQSCGAERRGIQPPNNTSRKSPAARNRTPSV